MNRLPHPDDGDWGRRHDRLEGWYCIGDVWMTREGSPAQEALVNSMAAEMDREILKRLAACVDYDYPCGVNGGLQNRR